MRIPTALIAIALGLPALGANPPDEPPTGASTVASQAADKLTSELSAYARALGYDSVRVDGPRLLLVQKGGATVPLGGVSGLRVASHAINRLRFDTETIVAFTPIETRADAFSASNAHAASHLARLAYLDAQTVKAQLGEWGFDTGTFHWLENAATDTQGFVVAGENGLIVTAFRGTSSMADVKTDADAAQIPAAWAAAAHRKKIHVHRGFNGSLESVWGDFSAALDDAKKKVTAKKGQTPNHLFVGHSLGGALSSLAALRSLHEGRIDGKRTQIYTNGAPRVGNDAFRAAFFPLAARTFRMVNTSSLLTDMVTRLPLKSMGYRHAGNLVLLSDDEPAIVSWSAAETRGALELAPGEEGPATPDPEDEELAGMTHEEIEREFAAAAGLAPSPEPLTRGVPIASLHFMGSYLDRSGRGVATPNEQPPPE